MLPARRPLTAACCSVLALLAAGCGASKTRASKQPSAPKQSQARPQHRSDPQLVRDSAPGAVVLDQWHLLKEGAAPAVLLSYSADVREKTGLTALAGAAAAIRQNLNGYTPVVRREESAGSARLLLVDAYNGAAPPLHYSYIMRRSEGRWLIWYDTLMESALKVYVQARVESGAPKGPSAAELAERFRIASAQGLAGPTSSKRARDPQG